MKQAMFLYVLASFFILCTLGLGILMLQSELNHQHRVNEGTFVTGTVIDVEFLGNEGFSTVISYRTKKGKKGIYRSIPYSNLPPPKIGEKRELVYEPTHQGYVEIIPGNGDGWIGWLFLGTLGTLGFGGLAWLLRDRKRHTLFRENGQLIQAKFEGIKWYGMSNKVPIQAVCSWTDPRTQVSYLFLSRFLQKHDNIEVFKTIQEIPVIINPEDPAEYWVDLSRLGLSTYM